MQTMIHLQGYRADSRIGRHPAERPGSGFRPAIGARRA